VYRQIIPMTILWYFYTHFASETNSPKQGTQNRHCQ